MKNLPSSHKRFYPFYGAISIRRQTKLHTQKQPDPRREQKREMKQRMISLERVLSHSGFKKSNRSQKCKHLV